MELVFVVVVVSAIEAQRSGALSSVCLSVEEETQKKSDVLKKNWEVGFIYMSERIVHVSRWCHLLTNAVARC